MRKGLSQRNQYFTPHPFPHAWWLKLPSDDARWLHEYQWLTFHAAAFAAIISVRFNFEIEFNNVVSHFLAIFDYCCYTNVCASAWGFIQRFVPLYYLSQ